MRTVTVKSEFEFRYELEDEGEYQNDGIPWTDKEIKQHFIELAAEDLMDNISNHPDITDRKEMFSWVSGSMTAEIIDE